MALPQVTRNVQTLKCICVTTGPAEAPVLPPSLLTEDNLVLTADAACPLLCPY